MKLLLFLCCILLPVLLYAQPQQVMCLGNSITQGNNAYPGYRYALWKKLIDAGIDFEYVGSHNENNAGPSPHQNEEYKGKTFTNQNEGHWGWSADQILYGHSEQPHKGKLSDWLTSYRPDIVLLHLGTNDMFRNHSIEETLNELREVVELIRGRNPNVTILFALLIPAYDLVAGPEAANNITLLNNEIPELAQELNTDASPVILVDQNTGFDATTGVDTWDGIHPNGNGEEKMAQRWFDAINQLIIEPLPVTLTYFDAKYTSAGKVKLDWKTASETNNQHFEIQRSAVDSVHFIPIGLVNGSGTTNAKTTYTFLDVLPPAGDLYYRLRQVDTDGTESFSKVVHVTAPKEEVGLHIFPTVAREDLLTINIQLQDPGTPVKLTVFAANGTVVHTITGSTDNSGNFRKKLEVESLQGNGLYIVKAMTDKEELQEKFIVDQ